MKWQNTQRGFGFVEIIILIAVLTLLGFGVWYFLKNNVDKDTTTQTNSTKQYSNSDLGISFNYKSDWTVTASTLSDSIVIEIASPLKINAINLDGQPSQATFTVNFRKWNNNSTLVTCSINRDTVLEDVTPLNTTFGNNVKLMLEKTVPTSGKGSVVIDALIAKVIDPSKPITCNNLSTIQAGDKNFFGTISFNFTGQPYTGDPTRYLTVDELKNSDQFKQALSFIKSLKPITSF